MCVCVRDVETERYLSGDPEVLALDFALAEEILQRVSHFFFVLIRVRAIDMPVSRGQLRPVSRCCNRSESTCIRSRLPSSQCDPLASL
jgi:hypothetical protein